MNEHSIKTSKDLKTQIVAIILVLQFFISVLASACTIPDSVVVRRITETSVEVSWNSVSGVTEYKVQYHPIGISSWIEVITQSDSVLLHSLSAGTAYLIRVQSICITDSSQFSPTLQFATKLPKPDHIVICIFENKDFNEIVNAAAAPYINSLINDSATALFTQSFAIEHPSFPNYLDLFSGNDQGIHQDTCLSNTFTTANLGAQLIGEGKSFLSYCEDLPFTGYTGCASGFYVKKHNAAVNWQGNDSNQISLMANLPFSSFPITDSFSVLPTVSIVIPNKINDMHSGTIQMGDSWLEKNLAAYIDWAKTHNSLFICTFDEDDSSADNHITTFFTGEMIQGGQYSIPINHFSVLRTIEEMYGLPFIGNADTAKTILGCWKNQDSIAAAIDIPTISINSKSKLEIQPSIVTTKSKILISLPRTENITLDILNTWGVPVASIVDNQLVENGNHTFLFSPKTVLVSPGLYFVRLVTQDGLCTKQIVVE